MKENHFKAELYDGFGKCQIKSCQEMASFRVNTPDGPLLICDYHEEKEKNKRGNHD